LDLVGLIDWLGLLYLLYFQRIWWASKANNKSVGSWYINKGIVINFYNYKRKIIQIYPILSYPISFSILAIAYAFITFSAVSIGRI
jgi:hypothetical protein